MCIMLCSPTAQEVTMQPGKIRLINSGSQNPAGFTRTISLAAYNRLYRITTMVRAAEHRVP